MTTHNDPKPAAPAFWNEPAETPPPARSGSDVSQLADYAPPLLRPLARGVANGLGNGRGGLSPTSLVLLTILVLVFLTREAVETVNYWYSSQAAREQVSLFQVQQARERADTRVADANVRLIVEQEAETIAKRDQAIAAGAMPLAEGWGDARVGSAYAQMKRYHQLFDQTQEEVRRCHDTAQCSPGERQRWAARADVYYALFYKAVGFLRKEGFHEDGNRIVKYDQSGASSITYPVQASAFELEAEATSPKAAEESGRRVAR